MTPGVPRFPGFLRPPVRRRWRAGGPTCALACAALAAMAPAMAEETAVAPAPATPPAPAVQATTTGQRLIDLYDGAIASTGRVCEDYRRIRAMQLSLIRDIPFSEAYENVQSVMPVLAPVDRDLLRRAIRDPADLKSHETEVLRLKKDIEDMVALVLKLLLEIEKIREEMEHHPNHQHIEITLPELLNQDLLDLEAEPPPPDPAQERQEANTTLVERARQDDAERAKDLTPFMERPQPKVEDLQKQDQKDPEKRALLPQTTPPPPPQPTRIDPERTKLARRVTMEGEAKDWFFVDTWYTIGPFPNPARAHINQKFPPETVVDLDAAYLGKGGRQVAWTWMQSRSPMVVPHGAEEYGIWYAYTELYFDRPSDLWVAIGSDDKGNVWLNDQPIWLSGDQLKAWRPDEGFRKVHFPAGRNRILFRIENGWNAIGFSFGIRAGS